MVERIWSTARPIVLSWTDEASEIFIIDLPGDALGGILEHLRQQLEGAQVVRLDGLTLSPCLPLDALQLQRILRSSTHSTVHCLKGMLPNEGVCCHFYLWIKPERGQIEVEMVFWNDVCFPPGLPLQRHKRVLGSLLRLADQLRGDHHQSRCILSHEYNAEPRGLLNSSQVAIW